MSYLDGYGKEECKHCGLSRTVEGHDGCVGALKGVMNACCGHGDNKAAYVQFDHDNYIRDPNKKLIQGDEALNYIRRHSNIDYLKTR